MKAVYINSVGSISSQKTFDNSSFLDDIISYEDHIILAVDPNYKDYISPANSRRMGKGIKMGVVASKIALNEANLDTVDAIITGTGMGCLRDSKKFLSAIIDNDEQFLTPTSFIQSTHNTVGGQIALGLQCKGYNFTYVHASISFESAVLDAKLMLENNEANTILVGGVDEIEDYTCSLHKLVNHIKKEKVSSTDLLHSKTEGAVFSEGANFFVLSNLKQDSSYAQIVAISTYNTLNTNITDVANTFLKENNLNIEAIDLLVLGNNGDIAHDSFYNELSSGIFENTQQVYYKHLCGEFNTASSFGMWLASKILKTQKLPEAVKLNTVQVSNYKTILLYNQYRGENHSFTLLRRC
ncbi:beta-ketoacyl synthase N-terminal-like domain-containing protein [Flavivirga amylovorans]|uniref:Beta-ketoacyl synthase N-terminal-like domain-containing protein n=1 Tax=Flavivirga amylovorans TaxID=870486 RepID=A0ABT8WZ89_9FLAO|nr:beta-ketoacyl synthase N-terminal-like domain-containing protein [Flavivirga amylovorans]MDO5986952.1 beta-ketoacyl synthase N-terminal-like domain-containing protein [Flavivirga amylovorans]